VSRVEELEVEIKALSLDEFQELRVWLAEFDAELGRTQIRTDAAAGRLDAFAD